MGIKIFFSIALIALCAFTGRSLSMRHSRRSRMLSETMDGMQLLRIHMHDRMLPLQTALTRSNAIPLRMVGEEMSDMDSVSEAWERVKARETRQGKALDSLNAEDTKTMDALFSELGRGAGSEQEQLILASIKQLGRLEDQARIQAMECGRLYTTLGLLIGAALAIGLI